MDALLHALDGGDSRMPLPTAPTQQLRAALTKAQCAEEHMVYFLTDPTVGSKRKQAFLSGDCTVDQLVQAAQESKADVPVRTQQKASPWMKTGEYTCNACRQTKCEYRVDQVRASDEPARLLVRCTLCVDKKPWCPG